MRRGAATSGSASVLEKIERENLFLVPLDTSRHWYRYHQLFGELLRTELRRTEPDLVADLHRRAATWFETEGLIDEAVRHLVAGGDIARSADLIAADWADEFNGGGVSTVSGLLDLLPEETVLQDPRLSVARAWIALSVGQLDDAAEWIEAVETRSAADAADGGAIGAQIVVLRAVHSFKTAHVAAALRRLAGRSPSISAKRRWADQAPTASTDPRCTFRAAPTRREPPSGGPYSCRKVGDRRARSYALGHLALISAEQGARRRRTSDPPGFRQLPGHGGCRTPRDVMVSAATAEFLRMRGDAAAAAAAADMAVMSARQGGAILEVAKTLLVRAEVFEDLDDHQTAKASSKRSAPWCAIARTPASPRRCSLRPGGARVSR